MIPGAAEGEKKETEAIEQPKGVRLRSSSLHSQLSVYSCTRSDNRCNGLPDEYAHYRSAAPRERLYSHW